MQPEPTQTSQTALEEQSSSEHLASSNHGLSLHADSVRLPSAVLDPNAAVVDSHGAAARVRLSDTVDKLAPLQSRIEQYENDQSRRYVAPTSPPTIKDTTPIAAVPNEILTHVLSHLAPVDLASMSLVSRRFNDLVTTPHAWRSAFARYFPGPETLRGSDDYIGDAVVRSERRAFTRLTPRASWRSEYVIRTRMLRSLARGKPGQSSAAVSQSARSRVVTPEITYSTELYSTINHLHATWSIGLNKSAVKLVHGADDFGMASMSDPTLGKLDSWGSRDPFTWGQFAEEHPGDALYGLGPGELVAVPNVMDVSSVYGMVLGQGGPGGRLYFRHGQQQVHGRPAPVRDTVADYASGIPFISKASESYTSVWLAKSSNIPALSGGLIGMLSGASTGILSAYGLAAVGSPDDAAARRPQGELTARWVLSPGVPVIAIAVDDDYSLKRQAENRIWAVVLNALGEVYYLTKFPRRIQSEEGIDSDAWKTARTVYWTLAEPSRRSARADPYNEMSVDGSYSPRSSWNGMCLSQDQVRAETLEIQQFLQKKPKDIQKLCYGWDMRRKLEVDFAGDDGRNAGEAVVVVECGLEEGSASAITRYTRRRVHDRGSGSYASTPALTAASTPPSNSPSLFGSQRALAQPTPFSIDGPVSSLEQELDGSMTPRPLVEEWQISRLTFGGLKKVRISTTAIDMSTHATQTLSEDPLLNFADVSAASSPSLGPWSSQTATSADVPGQRARFIAVGTMIGTVLLWNIRESAMKSAGVVSNIEPVRIIYTDSPQIASLALTSLYVVHGGSDGLVQAWDPLASDTQPVRTLNSRFSSRARRQLVQAQASRRGVGINMYAAGAICLDPDATVLRGAVSLGNRIRFWSYSSSAADHYKSAKRRLRRGERGSNQVAERFGVVQRTNLKDYIASERFELEREKQERQREADHMAGRFGTELLDGSEEELIAYASMLSQESHAEEATRRSSDSESAVLSPSLSAFSSDKTPTPVGSPLASSKTDEELDADIAEAIRQSLQSTPSTPSYEIAFKPAKSRKKPLSKASPVASPFFASSSSKDEDDFEFAIQLSLAEQASKAALPDTDFPGLDSPSKGKQRQL